MIDERNENLEQNLENVLEPVLDEITGELKAIKIGGKEFSPQDLKNAIEKSKNLEAGYTKKFQELAEKEKLLESKVKTFEEFEGLLKQYPDMQKEIENTIKKYKEGKISAEQKNDELKEIKAELEKLKQIQIEKEKAEQMKIITEMWNKKINEAIDNAGITNEMAKKLIHRTVWTELAIRENFTEEDLYKEVQEAAKLFPSISKDKVKSTPSFVTGKGGTSANTGVKLPPIGSKEREIFNRNAWEKFKLKEE